jgi:hypothetical protein
MNFLVQGDIIERMSVLKATQKDEPEIPSTPTNKRTPFRKRVFLEAYSGLGNVRAAAKAAGISREAHYKWLESDAEYRKAFEALADRVGHELEDLAVDRVRNGVKRQLFRNGKPIKTKNGHLVYEVHFDTQLHIAMLKRFRPKLYREHVLQEHSGSINIVERLEAARARLLAIKHEEDDKAG